MGSSYNWSSQITSSLMDIYKCEYTGYVGELMYIGKAYELLASLIDMGTHRIPRNAQDFNDIQLVIQYIDEHFNENIKQSQLVKISKMSSTKLKTVFKNFTDHTISDYITTKRINYAKYLLIESQYSIEEIAIKVGFKTLPGFSSSFKKREGLSPLEYRKQSSFEFIDHQTYFNVKDLEG